MHEANSSRGRIILIQLMRFSIDSRLIRKVPAAYSDGVYAMAGQDRPSPRKLSDLFMQGDDGLPSVKNRTALFAFFGEDNYKIAEIIIHTV